MGFLHLGMITVSKIILLNHLSNGLSSLLFLLVGHGRSGGEKVYIEDFSVYVHDVINHVKDFKASYPEIPCFLIGHSMVNE